MLISHHAFLKNVRSASILHDASAYLSFTTLVLSNMIVSFWNWLSDLQITNYLQRLLNDVPTQMNE